MRCLVTAATRHGSTMEIASIISGILQDDGIETDVAEPDHVASLAGYDAVVLGSAIYMGRWLAPARELVDRCGDEFKGRRVWLFSCGPLGEPARPDREPIDVKSMRMATGAIDHRVFPGKLLKSQLGLGEKLVVAGARVPDGDFRPWDDVMDWAVDIADHLRTLDLARILDLAMPTPVEA